MYRRPLKCHLHFTSDTRTQDANTSRWKEHTMTPTTNPPTAGAAIPLEDNEHECFDVSNQGSTL